MSNELEQRVDALLQDFDAWVQETQGNDPLSRPERAIVKTFCWYMLKKAQAEKVQKLFEVAGGSDGA